MASDFLPKLLSTDGFMPHGHCYQWEPIPFWISVWSDVLIAVSYFAIAILLFVIIRRRRDVKFRGMFLLFSAFILLCGATHLVAMIGMWHPFYRFDALLKLATGLVSGLTAVLLAMKLGAVQKIPTPAQYRKAQDELRRESLEKIRAEEASRAKSMFLSHMSHELRTPLTSILCALDILESSDQSEDDKEITRIAQDSSNRLLHLINDVLDLSKAEAGKLSLSSEPFVLSQVVDNVCKLLRLQAEAKGIEVCAVLDEASPTVVLGDSARLNQVLVNLVGNAVKFTEVGAVEVRLHLKNEGREKVRARIEVEDSGSGMRQEELESIFDPFQQAGTSSEKERGTGLGLAISHELVELMQGKITVTSQEGAGTCFTVELPFERVNAEVEKEILTADDKEAQMVLEVKADRSLRILLVEDNSASQQIIRKMLRLRGHKVRSASNAAQAKRLFQADHGDVVLMDVRLGAESGLECTRALRELEAGGARTLIIGISAYSTEEDRVGALAAGMDAYLVKPVPAKRLIRLVEGL